MKDAAIVKYALFAAAVVDVLAGASLAVLVAVGPTWLVSRRFIFQPQRSEVI